MSDALEIEKTSTSPLATRLPDVRGRYGYNVTLAPTTWFRVGGPADAVFKPADLADLQHFLKECPTDIPVSVIGVASNLLVRDGGVEGVVIRLGGGFADVKVSGTQITAGAAMLDLNIAMLAQENGIGGLEFLSGIPGTLGGALRMNAGAYGREIRDVLVSATAVDRTGKLHTLTPDDMGFSYRHCSVDESFIFVGATLKGSLDVPGSIAARMKEIQTKREASQPIRTRTGGSTFANPEGAKAWELIDKAGGRGYKLGGAMVSEQHTNFLINFDKATAADIENLGEEMRRRVKEQSGIDLRWEIKRIGRKGEA